jgi:hypothetical protein
MHRSETQRRGRNAPFGPKTRLPGTYRQTEETETPIHRQKTRNESSKEKQEQEWQLEGERSDQA